MFDQKLSLTNIINLGKTHFSCQLNLFKQIRNIASVIRVNKQLLGWLVSFSGECATSDEDEYKGRLVARMRLHHPSSSEPEDV